MLENNRCKKGKKVPILIHKSHIKAIELILQIRKDAGVIESNAVVFAREE